MSQQRRKFPFLSLYQLLRLDIFLLLPSSGYSVSSSYQMYRGKAFFVRFFFPNNKENKHIFCYNQYISGYSIPFWKRHDCSHSQNQTFEHHFRYFKSTVFFKLSNRCDNQLSGQNAPIHRCLCLLPSISSADR